MRIQGTAAEQGSMGRKKSKETGQAGECSVVVVTGCHTIDLDHRQVIYYTILSANINTTNSSTTLSYHIY